MYDFKLEQTDIDIILRSLGEQPAKFTIKTILKIQEQCAQSNLVQPEVDNDGGNSNVGKI